MQKKDDVVVFLAEFNVMQVLSPRLQIQADPFHSIMKG